jgi:AraC-like DNA-binding protein
MYLGTTMYNSASRGNYGGRLDRVVTWLTDHLDEALDLARLADVACLSPYHFHRIYRPCRAKPWRRRFGGCDCIVRPAS